MDPTQVVEATQAVEPSRANVCEALEPPQDETQLESSSDCDGIDIPAGSDFALSGKPIPASSWKMEVATPLRTRPSVPTEHYSPSPGYDETPHKTPAKRKHTLSPRKNAISDEDERNSPIPSRDDTTAEKPVLGELQISPQAMRMRAQRIFKPRANGTRKVSDEVYNEWHAKGSRRKMLEHIFATCGFDPEPWCIDFCGCKQFSCRTRFRPTLGCLRKLLSPKWTCCAARSWNPRSLWRASMFLWQP